MAVPTPVRAEQILRSHELPEPIIIHARGVARVACAAGQLVAASGLPLDVALVEVAALLHDIDKIETRRSGGEHGIVGARWLTEMGYEELALPVASHPVTCLIDDERFPRGWPSVIVSVADRHVAQVYLSIDERIDEMIGRHPEYRDGLELARRPAHQLEQELAEVTGLTLEELDGRLRDAWQAGA